MSIVDFEINLQQPNSIETIFLARIFSAHQRRCEKVMFQLCLSIYRGDGGSFTLVTITHDALHLTIQGPPLALVLCSPPPTHRHGTSLYMEPPWPYPHPPTWDLTVHHPHRHAKTYFNWTSLYRDPLDMFKFVHYEY